LTSMTISIPPQLQHPDFRFILTSKTKIPIEEKWNTLNNYAFNDTKLLKHIKAGKNYATLCGAGYLIVVDWDDKKLWDAVKDRLPPTMTVQTGRGWGLHTYYKIIDKKTTTVKIKNKEGIAVVEVLGKGTSAIGPSCIHPSGKTYNITQDLPIAEVSYSEILALFSPWLDTEDKPLVKKYRKNRFIEEIKARLPVSKLLSDLGIDISINPTQCPLHASLRGKCLSFDDEKQVWHCFHCGQAGDVITLYMLVNDTDFNTTKNKLADQLEIKDPVILDKIKNIRSLQSLIDEGVPVIEWIVEDIIPKQGVTIFGGTAGSYKTFIAMSLSLSCATGTKFLNKYDTNKCNVLYIDEENGRISLLSRYDKLLKGVDITERVENLFLSFFNTVNIDAPDTEETISAFIDAFNINLIIIDSMVRCMIGDENKATDVRKIFDNLKQIFTTLQTPISIVLIHHTTKSNQRSLVGLRVKLQRVKHYVS